MARSASATVWHAGMRARDEGQAGAESFPEELVWREFSYHLMHHTPHITTRQLEAGVGRFPLAR